ncbi:MAG: FHA domain-containing protein, partial [Labilithrix sp.]|nr:FHA domain-containing protein [Labilithrix sp.]
MFAIIISEKGGAERRESFDKNEINVGRVQGNDLMLPKGNVSKHHARLLFRDGRFIVTDLKSTNGTYVNGRKIAQATIVREGDKIYIGDFVLRLETNGAAGASVPPPADPGATAAAPQETAASLADEARTAMAGSPAPVAPPKPLPNPPAVTLKAPTHPPGAPLPRPQVSNVSNAPSLGSSSPQYPLDQDPDDSAPMQKPPPRNSASPPALGGSGGIRPMTMPLNVSAPGLAGLGGRPVTPGGLPPL